MSDRVLVATRKGLFTVRRRAARDWRVDDVAFLADRVSLALHDPRDGAVYAALNHGHFGVKIHRSDDGGASWEEIAAPAFPARPDDAPEERNSMGKIVPWKVLDVWALEAGGLGQDGRLWCGTIPGGLFRSDDRGASWELVRPLWDHPTRRDWFGGGADQPGIHSVCVDPRDPRRVAVGVSCAGVWVTEDDGGSWNVHANGMRAAYMPPERAFDPLVQDPHRVVQCRRTPDRYWVQHHNGIFKSDDGGRTWTEIEAAGPSTFGFAVAVHPDDPDTAWFVPATKDERRVPVEGRVVVTRTRDGGRTFETLSAGLPQEHAYDLVYRHALDVDDAGERLAFGSTTGALWVSEDQGDRFAEISAHLPPVYGVRFA